MNSFRSLGGEHGSRIGFLATLCLAISLLALAAFAGSASAASVTCGGKVALDKEQSAENSLRYSVQCSEDVQGYSIISNRELGYFSTEVSVLDGTEVAEGENFTCEGGIPGNGIGCYGKMAAGHTVEGHVATSDDLCEAAVQPKFWAVALTTQIMKDKPVPVTSEPFPLGGLRCATLNGKKKAKNKARRVCAKVKFASSRKARSAAKKRCRTAQKTAAKVARA